MASAVAVSRDVEGAEAPHDLVSGPGAGDIGPVDKIADRLDQRVAIGFEPAARRNSQRSI